MAANSGHSVVDLSAFFGAQVVQAGTDVCDESADAGDLVLGRHGLGACPVVEAMGGEHPLPVAQKVVQVGLQVGEVGDVGPEVPATHAAETERASVAAGFYVGGLGAHPVGHRDLADCIAGMLGLEQCPRLGPDALAVPVEAERGDPLDGGTTTVLPNLWRSGIFKQ